MEMIPVESSNVDEIGYDEDREVLHIKFLNGSLYEYDEVPKDVWQAFLDAPSKGKFVWSDIRGNYSYRRLH